MFMGMGVPPLVAGVGWFGRWSVKKPAETLPERQLAWPVCMALSGRLLTESNADRRPDLNRTQRRPSRQPRGRR